MSTEGVETVTDFGSGNCGGCGDEIEPGDVVTWLPDQSRVHDNDACIDLATTGQRPQTSHSDRTATG